MHNIIYPQFSIFKGKILQWQLDSIKHSSGKIPYFFKTSFVVVFPKKKMKNLCSLASKCILWTRNGVWKMFWLEFNLNVPLFNYFEEDTIIFMYKGGNWSCSLTSNIESLLVVLFVSYLWSIKSLVMHNMTCWLVFLVSLFHVWRRSFLSVFKMMVTNMNSGYWRVFSPFSFGSLLFFFFFFLQFNYPMSLFVQSVSENRPRFVFVCFDLRYVIFLYAHENLHGYFVSFNLPAKLSFLLYFYPIVFFFVGICLFVMFLLDLCSIVFVLQSIFAFLVMILWGLEEIFVGVCLLW